MMKLDPTNLHRIDEGPPSKLQRLIRRSRRRRPSTDATSRMAARLASAGVFAAEAPTSSGGPALLDGVRAGGATLRRLAFGVGGGALALVALGAAWSAWQERPADRMSDAVVAPTTADRTGPSALGTTAAVDSAAVPQPLSTIVPVVSVDELPSTRPGLVATSSTRTEVRSSSPPAPRRSESEFAIIKRAQDAVLSSPAQALDLAEQHPRAFPTGDLRREREVVAVEALPRLGRKTEAKSRANALLTRYPRTPYVVRLERALGEPLSPAPSTSGR